MSYYWFNRKELLKKAHTKYEEGGKEKIKKYYQTNKQPIKKKERHKYQTMSSKKDQETDIIN